MEPVTTYVFLDLETSGLPCEEYNKTRITEISLIAIKRQHLLATRNGALPRIQHKLTLCINPQKMMSFEGTAITGLCNNLLEFETPFNMETFNTINSFLGLLAKPVCLIAYNGLHFDYPILKARLVKLNVNFSDDLLCADAYHAFHYILEQRNSLIMKNNNVTMNNSYSDPKEQANEEQEVKEPLIKESLTNSQKDALINDESNFTAMQKINETTPKRKLNSITHPHTPKKCNRSLQFSKYPWRDGPKPTESYKLKHVYERVLKREAIEAHRAENDCILLMEVVVALSKEFVEWVDSNHCAFAAVKPMRPGVPIGK